LLKHTSRPQGKAAGGMTDKKSELMLIKRATAVVAKTECCEWSTQI